MAVTLPREPTPDQVWFEQVYRSTYQATLAYAWRRTRDSTDAQDLVADTYMVAWRRLDELREIGRPELWLYGVAHHIWLNQRRGATRHVALVERVSSQAQFENVADPAEETIHRENLAMVEQAMTELTRRDQEILRLAAYEELDHTEISAVLGIRSPLVRAALYRARQRLNRAIRELALGTAPYPDGYIEATSTEEDKI